MLPEFKPQSNYYGSGPRPDNIHALRAAFYNQALTSFNRARTRAILRRLWCSVVKTPNCLQDLQTISSQDYTNRYYAGLQPVALDQIVGTLGRSEWFDAQFYPLTEQVRDRWLSIAMAHLMFVPLDPVQLIRVGQGYFIQDGHHRVSVSSVFGEHVIDAEVVVWERV
ncbi:MAG TPA: hypothetical protein VLM80_07210 [Anaerolineales bacterium]|nr:hypothetical protein [Anaerolineales bacterium]